MKKRVAYLGKIQLSDVDLSYLHAAQHNADITYYMEVNPRFMRGPAYSFKQLAHRTGIFKATTIYPELSHLGTFIDTDRFYIVNTYGRLWALKSIWLNIMLAVTLLRSHFDTIHLTWPPNIYEFPLYLLRRRMVLTMHDPFPHDDAEHTTFIVRLRRWCALHLIPRFIILNKTQHRQFLDTFRLRESQVLVSRLSSYDYLQSVQPSPLPPKTTPLILFAGKISPYKGVEYLLEAMTKIHDTHTDAKLIVAGAGQYHFDLAPYKDLDYIDIRNHFIPDAELVALLRQADMVVCPYTNATQSGVVMSAFAFSCPVIVTRVGALPEMVNHGGREMGLVVEPCDAQSLGSAMTRLLSDPELQHTLRRNIQSNYGSGSLSWREIADEITTFYN